MILIYAFSNRWGTNISRRVLSGLGNLISHKSAEFIPIYYHPRQFFRKYIEPHHYEKIIGLGDFYGNSSKIRIETMAKNVYNQESIHPFSPYQLEISLPPLDLVDSSIFSVTENMGNYNCNWIAYKIEMEIRHYKLDYHQIFLHLPQKGNYQKITTAIFNLLTSNLVIK